MRDKKEYNNQPDDFSLLVKGKMEEHRMAVDNDIWAGIEQQLKPRGQRRWLWWAAGAAAAVAVVVFVFLLRPQDNLIQLPATVGQVEPTEKDLINSTAKQEQKPASLAAKEKRVNRSVGLFSQRSESESTSRASNDVASIETSLSSDSILQVTDEALSIHIADAESGASTSDSPRAKSSVNTLTRKDEPKVWLADKGSEKKDKEWLLAAGFSSNGQSLSNNVAKNYDNAAQNNGAYYGPSENNDGNYSLVLPNDAYLFDEADHQLPLSFGISVRKRIMGNFGLETGLVYTYLSSRFSSGSGKYRSEAKQQLHYLGIPLNAVIYLWDNPKWNLYLSAGGMAEKGLQRKYSSDGNGVKTNLTESINGMQWSLNASVGISYRFYQNWDVYFEPRFSHYFDNNQPRSIRTDNKNIFGFTAGFRVGF